MAHFAQLDEYNNVISVIVIDNSDILDENGFESEEIGINFCKKLFGEDTIWKQTSYNKNFRFNYASVGMTYDEEHDAFILSQPYPSWTLNIEDFNWYPPVFPPELTEDQINSGDFYIWNEDKMQWEMRNRNLSF